MKTQFILTEERKKVDYKINKLPSIIISTFTCIFAYSIVFKIKEQVPFFIFIVLSIFLAIFLVFNEYLKIKELVSYFKKDGKGNLFIMLLTFVLSVSLSIIGVHLWLSEPDSKANIKFDAQVEEIEKLNVNLNNSLKEIDKDFSLTANETYKQEYQNLEFNKRQLKSVWKTQDRKPILDKINEIENNIRIISQKIETEKSLRVREIKKNFELKLKSIKDKQLLERSQNTKNTFIVYVLCFLTLLNDFCAILFARVMAGKEKIKEEFLNSEMVIKYLKFRTFLKTFLLKKEFGDIVKINEVKTLSGWEWTDISMFFGILDNSKIIEVTEKSIGKLSLTHTDALKAFDTYFNNYFEI